jgi:hypothetical protein
MEFAGSKVRPLVLFLKLVGSETNYHLKVEVRPLNLLALLSSPLWL